LIFRGDFMEKKEKIRLIVLAGLIGAAIAAICISVYLLQIFGGFELCREVAKYAEARQVIQEKYVGELDDSTITDLSIAGAITALEDQWSYYMTEEEYLLYQEYAQNTYTGIGITIQECDSGVLVLSVEENSPAEKGGLQEGDILTKIDGTDLAGLATTELRSMLSNTDQEVVLTVQRNGELLECDVIAEVIYQDPVEYELLENKIGYIKIKNFEEDSGEGAIDATEDLIAQGATALIYDVRDNPGGKVRELIKILDYLLPEGDIFVSVSKDGEETISSSDAACVELPIAVLVNENSYSAAEYFAAALQEYDWGEIVGTATTGKGRSQQTFLLSDGSAIHLSTNAYLTPERVDLSEQGGIIPDYEVAADETVDNQLEKAVEILA
jgi:carboxyl-terminal processing protease